MGLAIVQEIPAPCIFSRRCIGGHLNLVLSLAPSVDFTNFTCWFKLTVLSLKLENTELLPHGFYLKLLLQPCGSEFRNIFPKITPPFEPLNASNNESFRLLFTAEGFAGFESSKNGSVESPVVEMEWAFPKYLADLVFQLNLEVGMEQQGKSWTWQQYSFALAMRPYSLGNGNSKDIFPSKQAWLEKLPSSYDTMPDSTRRHWNKFLNKYGLQGLDIFTEKIQVCNVFMSQKDNSRKMLPELTQNVRTWLLQNEGKVKTEECVPMVFKGDIGNAITQLEINQPFTKKLVLNSFEDPSCPLSKLEPHHLLSLALKNEQVLELWLVVQVYYCNGLKLVWRGGRFEAMKKVPFAFRAIRFKYNSRGIRLIDSPRPWLLYYGCISKHDVAIVVKDHGQRSLGSYLNIGYKFSPNMDMYPMVF